MKKHWVIKELPDDAVVAQLCEHLHLERPLATLLAQRGITTVQQARDFFEPNIEKLHDPFLMKDMSVAVERLSKAIVHDEKIMVYGDYDVDGTSAVALVYSFLCEIRGSDAHEYIKYYIPDRYTEGYGITEKGIQFCRDNGINLLISLDCGIKANDMVDLANQYGIDVIITDHHLEGDTLPNALAILDPKRKDCTYPYKELSGCGVGFKLVQGYCFRNGLPDELWLKRMDLVAVSIACDIVAITGENRILAHFGLEMINKIPRMGIRAILDQAGIKMRTYPPFSEDTFFTRVISISDLVFYVGPRINAAGRIKSAKESVRLFIVEDEDKSMEISTRINKQNNERKQKDKNATEEAMDMIRNSHEFENRKSIVIYNPQWEKGIIGIVASRLVEEFYKPTIVLMSSDDGLITGSARSVKEFNIYDGIDSCADLLEHFGGHKYAAGLTMKQENLEEFSQRFEEYVKDNLDESSYEPEITVDMRLKLSEITPHFMKNLKKFAPFGPGNMEPVFETDGVVDEGNARIVGDKHLKCRVLSPYERSGSFDGIAFNQKSLLPVISDSKPFNVLYHVEENRWNNVVSTQLNIKDIEPATPMTDQEGHNNDTMDDYTYRTGSSKKDSHSA